MLSDTHPSLEYFAMFITLATTVIEEQTEIHAETDLESADAAPVARSGPVAMRNLETVARLYYLRHGFEACDSFMTYFLALLASISLRALEGSGDGARLSPGRGRPEVLRSTLVLAMKGLRDQGRHLHVCKVLFRLLRDRLPPAEADILGRFVVTPGEGSAAGSSASGGASAEAEEEEEEREADLALHTRSRFPVPVVKSMYKPCLAPLRLPIPYCIGVFQSASLRTSWQVANAQQWGRTSMRRFWRTLWRSTMLSAWRAVIVVVLGMVRMRR